MAKRSNMGLMAALVLLGMSQAVSGVTVSGDLMQWNKTTLTFTGPSTSETAGTNPFLDYRLDVTFMQGDKTYVVPGYYAADGDAGNTGASSGDKWRVQFSAPSTGTWNWQVSFRQGSGIAVSGAAGTSTYFDGQSGTFSVIASDKSGDDFRAKGLLTLAPGKHYLQFAGTGQYWIKGGTDSPEDFLGYSEFDNTVTGTSTFPVTTYPDHVGDWNTGDPTWRNGKGKGIIGALNYLGSQKVNSVYFLPMNLGGDGQNTHPFASTSSDLIYDCSKLDQWGMVFDHAQKNGIMLQVVLNEAEAANRNRLDGGTLGTERKLFYRELVARFGHVNGLMWNICEEGIGSFEPASIMKSFADYIRSVDPYDHPIGVHNWIKEDGIDTVFADFYGHPSIDYLSIQYRSSYVRTDYPDPRYPHLLGDLRAGTASAGKPLALMGDELEMTLTSDDETYTTGVVAQGGMQWQRKAQLWQWYLGGGAGVEYILTTVLNTHDFRQYEPLWRYTRYAREFMDLIPFGDMVPSHDLLTGESTYDKSAPKISGVVLAKPGEVYAIQLPNATSTGTLDLSGASGTFTMRWYNPRTGKFEGETTTITGGGNVALGSPPSSPGEDWVILIRSTAVPTTAIWDNNNGVGDLRWETATNWYPDGEPDATSQCTIDNGDIVGLSGAGKLAKSIELGKTKATRLNVSGKLIVSAAANVGQYGTLNVSGGLTTGAFNSAGIVTIGAAATDGAGVGRPSLGPVVVTGGSINSAVRIDSASLNIDAGSVTSVGATVTGGAAVTGGGSLDTGTGGLVAATVTVVNGSLSTVGGTIAVSLDVSGTGSAEVGGVAVPVVTLDATGSVTAANAMTVSDKIVMGDHKIISVSAGHTFGAAGRFSDNDDDARTLILDTAGSTLTITTGVARAGTILFHGANATASAYDDGAVLARLQSLYGASNVTYMQGSAAAGDGSSANGYDAVIISSTINSADVRNKYEDATLGVLNWEAGLVHNDNVGNFFMCDGQGAATSQTQITIVDPSHSLAAGLSGTVTVASSPQTYQTGTGARGAGVDLVASTISGAHAILAADVGDALLGNGTAGSPSVAAGRRVFFFLHDATFHALTADGLKLFDAAVAYALAGSPPEEQGLTWPKTDIVVTADSTLNLPGSGAVTLGNLTLAGNPNPILVVAGPSKVSLKGLSGTGGLAGNLEFEIRETLSPGAGAGTVTFGGNVTFGPLARLEIELAGSDNSNPLAPQYDCLDAAGEIALDGELEVTLLHAFTPKVGDEFTLIDGLALSGGFSGMSLPSLGDGMEWLIRRTTGDFVLTVALLGDADLSGVVDAADYIALKSHFGLGSSATRAQGDLDADGDVDRDDLQILMGNFGAGGGSAQPTTPEPATLALVGIGGLALIRRRRPPVSISVPQGARIKATGAYRTHVGSTSQ